MNDPKIYCLSGLGANELAYAKIGKLKYDKIVIPWLINKSNETLDKYSNRIIKKYAIRGNDILMGLSFGGLICQNIATKLNTEKVILISSFRDKNDLKKIFNVGINSKIYRLLPAKRVGIIDEIVATFLNSGTESSKPTLKKMLNEANYNLINWSIDKIATTEKQELIGTKILNLLGSDDRIVKKWNVDQTIIIEKGSHFMIYDKADEVTKHINQFIK